VISATIIATLRTLAARGHSRSSAARTLGLNRTRVGRLARKHAIPFRFRGPPVEQCRRGGAASGAKQTREHLAAIGRKAKKATPREHYLRMAAASVASPNRHKCRRPARVEPAVAREPRSLADMRRDALAAACARAGLA
jgi:hypothetical protein